MTTAGSCARSASIAPAPVAGADDLIALVGPFELALQALVVLDDQQHGKFGSLVMRVSVHGSAAGLGGRQEDGEGGALAGAAVDAEPAAHGGDERARFERADAEAAGLVEAKGWNRRLRTKSPSMPTPLSAIAMVTACRSGASTRTVTGSVSWLASSAFWTRWPTACSSAVASTTAHSACIAKQLHVAVAALARRWPR